MNMQTVKSSVIKSIGHDPETKEMRVQFHNGKTYTYQGVSEEAHLDFVTSDSIGKHFNNHIAGKYHVK